MISSTLRHALMASSVLSVLLPAVSAETVLPPIASATYSPVAPPAMLSKGCYRSPQPLQNIGIYKYQSEGNCQSNCLGYNQKVMALANGWGCWCGNELPALADQVDQSECDVDCTGYPDDQCGGEERWHVWQISNEAVEHVGGGGSGSTGGNGGNSVSSTKPPPSKTAFSEKISTVTNKGSTVIKTFTVPADPASTSGSSSDDDSGTNVGGIIAGVVVGVVVLLAIVAGVWFYLRHQRKKRERDGDKQAASLAAFVDGGKKPPTTSSSMNDSRLDPEIWHRRESTGSIADNRDYSRRILQVTNPDGN